MTDSRLCGIQEDTACTVDSISSCNIGDEGDNDDTENTISNSINVNNIETEGTGNVSSIVSACNTDVSYQNRTDDLDLAKIPKPFFVLKLHKNKLLWQSIMMFCCYN